MLPSARGEVLLARNQNNLTLLTSKKFKMKKLKLENLKVKVLTKEEQKNVNGGKEQEQFLSIGTTCSLRNSCERVCGPIIA